MGKRRKCNILIESNKESEDSKAMTLELNNSQEKSSTNAFQLLMESRLKSIGSNSPGKHRPVIEPECQELLEKKELKAKRVLSLQKMAEAKGSLKNKELEEFRDRSIKKQLSKQAETFKLMLSQENTESKNKTNENKEHSLSDIEIIDDNDTHLLDVKKTLQLCNMFEKSDAEGFSKKLTNKKVSTEDMEFLSKLSPSIRKKENMMSYFPKVEEKVADTDNPADEVEVTDTIKVKFNSKIMKKISHRRNRDQNFLNNPQIKTEISRCDEIQDLTKSRKLKVSECTTSNLIPIEDTEVINDGKLPKRKTKRPAKYLDDAEVSSSDEELYIFTPKKKKNSGRLTVNKSTLNSIGMKELCQNKNPSIIENHENSQSQIKSMKCRDHKLINPLKLAPIFTSKLSNLVAEKEARQKFLHSGIPQKLKKDNSQPKNNTSKLEFHPVVHIQQNIAKTLDKIEINFSSLCDSSLMINDSNLETNDNLFKSLTSLDEEVKQIIPSNQHDQENLLHMIKHSYRKFPVYRTYHLLKGKSNGENKDFNYPDLDNSIEIIHDLPNDFDSLDKLCWVEKYKPTSTKQIIGNFAAIDELKKWLQSWTESLVKTKKGGGSGSSDFDDFQDSDDESRETLRTSNNVLVIYGDVGSGKTSSVYAVAAELAIKVIEVNSSSKRTGKIMLQDLQEATRSHKVDRGKSNSDNSQKLQETAKPKLPKKRGRPKKAKDLSKDVKKIENMKCIVECSSSQDSVRTDSSLILIDDADIVFEQDDGFCSAISQLIQSSKRPVILITSSLSCQHLQKFIQLGKIIKMHKFLPRMSGTWLDIMCVADTGICFPGLGDGLLDYYKGDIRKTIHSLQFYMVSYKHSTCENSQEIHDKLSVEDENSCLSWTDEYNTDKTTQPNTSKNLVQQHIKVISLGAPLDLLSVWWSISNVYESHIENDNQDSKQLISISNGLSIISEADCFTKRANTCNKMWYPKESASLNETESYEYYNRNNEVSKDIARELGLLGSKCTTNCKSEVIIDISAPGYYTEREQEKIASRHHTLSSYLNLGVVLDRRALALDYWPSCRTICRLEKNTLNTKRNNRFCHYLKSLNVLCKNDYFDALSKSLNNAL
ncbi:ATPase family AAA domain-containing protein 5 [Pieris napi]|uniref:ATPase family AAA domain-containing protein 5 n=1 Tax=Pieris napi TaxID=78633 RepID=UPI001FBBAF47|nr:ATPase family AAA domain-containing protein 5 [Pieris napi]